MFTVGQLLAIETRRSLPPWHADLFEKYPTKALSLRSVINAIEQQKRGFFVQLRSASLLREVTSGRLDDLQRRLKAGEGKISRSEIVDFQKNVLQPLGVSLKLVTSDGRALIVGTTAALASVPTLRLDSDHTVTGVIAISSGAAIVGGLIVLVVPPLSIPYWIGLGIEAIAGGALIGVGAAVLNPSEPRVVPSKPASPTNTNPEETPDDNEVPQPDGDEVNVPNVELYGDPPEGVNVDQVLAGVAGDLGLIPNGLDLNTGKGLPDIPHFGDVGDPGDEGDGSGIDIGFG